jgi:hypothetical protein
VACRLRGLAVCGPLSKSRFQVTRMSPHRHRMIEDMKVRNLSPATQRSCNSAVLKFRRYFGRSPYKLELEDVQAFQGHPSSRAFHGRR